MHDVVEDNDNVVAIIPIVVTESPKVVPESRIVIASELFLQHILEEQKNEHPYTNKNAHIVLSW